MAAAGSGPVVVERPAVARCRSFLLPPAPAGRTCLIENAANLGVGAALNPSIRSGLRKIQSTPNMAPRSEQYVPQHELTEEVAVCCQRGDHGSHTCSAKRLVRVGGGFVVILLRWSPGLPPMGQSGGFKVLKERLH